MVTVLQPSERDNKSKDAVIDIHGRIEALDQNLRSLEHRLRAVEKRLSIKTPGTRLVGGQDIEDQGEDDVHIEIEKLRTSVKESQKSVDEIRTEGRKLNEIEQKLAGLEKTLDEKDNRIKKLENQNKITIGKIKVPIELSGLVAAIVLITTGYLISSGSWEIIRSSYYAIAIGILFGAVVLVKFIMTNRQ